MGFPYTFPFKFKEFSRILMVKTEIKGHHKISARCSANHAITTYKFRENHQIDINLAANHSINMNMQPHHLIQSSLLGGGKE